MSVDLDRAPVWIVAADDRLTAEPIEVIQEVQDTVFFRAAVEDGARVVVSDLAVMTEGMEVTVAGSDAAAVVAAQESDPESTTSPAAGGGA